MENSDKLAVITGASKGIGRAIAEAFAGEGMNLAIYSRGQKDLEDFKQYLEGTYNVKVYHRAVDGSDRKQVESFAEMVLGLPHPLEILVNNTGTFVPGTILEEEEGAVVTMIETNVYSAYYLTRKLGTVMKKNGRGHIFNMCSTASIMAYPNGGSYCISKHALLGFNRVLREELKEHGVRVTAILPGATWTASWDGVDLPESRLMKATDVAGAVLSAYRMSPNTVQEEILLRPQLGDL